MMLAGLSPEAYRRANEIADAVVGLAPPSRGAELDRLCGGDTSLRVAVDLLLAADGGATGPDAPDGDPPAAATPHPSQTATPHPAVPGYTILREVGRGGMGVVYKARQISLNRAVALKMVLAGELAGVAEVARARAEAQQLARLAHPNIVPVYDVGECQGRPYFAMEFMDGGSLAKKLGREPQPVRAAAQLVETLARAAHHAHERGVVHRDLKPANVLLATDGTPKIADFGVAKCLEGGSGLTQTGAILGTPSYMAPEQAEGQAKLVGPAADVYALGAILYEALTGRPPFHAESAVKTLVLVITRPPVPPRELRPDVPADIEAVCLQCLRKKPAERYPTAAALADDLRRWLDGRPTDATAAPMEPPRRKRWNFRLSFSITISFVLLLVFGLGMLFRQIKTEHRRGAGAQELAGEEKGNGNAVVDNSLDRFTPKGRIPASRHGQVGATVDDLRPVPLNVKLSASGAWAKLDVAVKGQGGLWPVRIELIPPPGVEVRPAAIMLGLDGSETTAHFELRATTAATIGPSSVRIVVQGANELTKMLPVVVERADSPPSVAPPNELVANPDRAPERRQLVSRGGRPTCVTIYADGRSAVAGASDGKIELWDLVTGERKWTAEAHPGGVLSVAIAPDGKLVVSGGADKQVRLWNMFTGKEVKEFDKWHDDAVWLVRFDGSVPVSTSADKVIHWDRYSGRPLGVRDPITGTAKNNTGQVEAGYALQPSTRVPTDHGDCALSGLGSRTLELWRRSGERYRAVARLIGGGAAFRVAAVSADGRRVLAYSPDDRAVRLWSLDRARLTGAPAPQGAAAKKAAPPDTPDGNVPQMAESTTWKSDADVSCAALSHDGRMALLGSPDGTLRLWQLPP
jgi:serine/threonine protein kinase